MTIVERVPKSLPSLSTARKMAQWAFILGGPLIHCAAQAQTAPSAEPIASDPLQSGFEAPPPSARPRVWWHWMNGNITREGIDKDLAWMQRIGVGGLSVFDANIATPKIVEQRLVYMHPDWQDAFRHTVERAGLAGLDVAIPGSPGWSETGGPWVPPEDGLKKLVWSETVVLGGRHFTGRLPEAPGVTGPFQTLPLNDPLASISGDRAKPPPQLSGNVAVLAYPLDAPPLTAVAQLLGPDGHPMDAAPLLDADPEGGPTLAKGTPADAATLTYVFDAPQAVRSVTLFAPGQKSLFTGAAVAPELQASDNGVDWRDVAAIPAAEVPTTVSFPPVTATYFRVRFVLQNATAPNLGSPALGADLSQADIARGTAEKPLRVTEFRLFGESRVSQFERKAAFAYVPDYYALDSRDPATPGADPARVVDLTGRVRADGTLDWTPPAGSAWRIVRLGWSLLGTTNHPAPAEATGLEVDKFDGAAVRRYLEHYLDTYRRTVGDGKIGGAGITALQTDSIEVGAANWTPRMLEQFRRLRGYDPTPWLPTLTGGLIGTREQSDRFLYDYRRTLADLIASEHYGTVATVGREQGLTVYSEALENGRPQIGDDMTMRSHADIPMAAMWTYSRDEQANPSFVADVKGAASVAHIYGRKLVAAESMTSALNPWAYAPSDLRRIIDLAFVNGVNRPFIHSVVHQPVDNHQPGLSLSVFGQFFNRHETWADMARPWMDYLARTSFLLQQGTNVADVAYFYGEEAPLTGLYRERLVADAPSRYAYDFISPDALMNQVRVDHHELVATSGARYRLLYLGGVAEDDLGHLAAAGAIGAGWAYVGRPGARNKPQPWR
jgi:alpha-L-rhamnosidase